MCPEPQAVLGCGSSRSSAISTAAISSASLTAARTRPAPTLSDFAMHLVQDVSVGYLDHTPTTVRLYLQEAFAFLDATSEAAVALTSSS
ncbi:MAG: hypothetical protein QOG10_4100 [Kribbellaceae bacterium]|nr:hypothetical protein [Kribbellaceae bacterium]